MVEVRELAKQSSYELAKERGEARLAGVRAVGSRFDGERRMIFVELSNGLEIGFSPEMAEGLEGASAEALGMCEITPAGMGIHFPLLDADIYVPGLLEGLTGSRKWAASAMGKAGGLSRSFEKSAAARENGKRGGRPRKSAA